MTAEYTKVALTNEIPAGLVKVVVVNGERIAICNYNNSFYAIADLCTRDNAPLDEGTLDGCEITCPRHGARFDVTNGKALCLPAVRPVPTFPVEIRGDEIWLGPRN